MITSPLNPLSLPPIGCELIACLAVERHVTARMDLMMGIHPEQQRHLTELEERAMRWTFLLDPKQKLSASDDFSRALALWRNHWPGWEPSEEARRSVTKSIEERWRHIMPHCVPTGAAYFFSTIRPDSPEVHEESQKLYDKTIRDLEQQARTSPHSKKSIIWTTSLYPAGGLRQVFEELCGLTESVKARLGIESKHPGLLRRYATANRIPIDELLDPRQFEHLVADIYRADGWDCRVTAYSKDGGFDVEAHRSIDGVPTVMLIQAKRNRSKSRPGVKDRPVGIDEVKAFAATVRGEGRDSGVLVTSSHVTRDGRDWAATKGQRVANLQFLDGDGIRARLHEISRGQKAGDVAAYLLDIASRQ